MAQNKTLENTQNPKKFQNENNHNKKILFQFQKMGTKTRGTQTRGTQTRDNQTRGTKTEGTQSGGTQAEGTQIEGTQTGGTHTSEYIYWGYPDQEKRGTLIQNLLKVMLKARTHGLKSL